jgi:hypothetical protein
MAGLDADEYALDELTCPITGEIFLDPVLCVGDGHTYERLAAERWLATHATSPLTGQPLAQPEGLTLVENHSVRKQACALIQRRPELRPTAPPAPHLDPPPPNAPPVRDLIDLAEPGDALEKKGNDDKSSAAKKSSFPTAHSSCAAPQRDAPSSTATLKGGKGGNGNPFDPPLASSLVVKVLVSSKESMGGHSRTGSSTNVPPRAFALRPSRRAPRWEHGDGASGNGFLAASASGDLVACSSANSSVVTAWRPGVGTARAPRPPAAQVRADDWVLCGAVAPRGDWVCAAGRGKFLHLWRVDSLNPEPGSVFVSETSSKFETVPNDDAPWHKDFTTCVAALDETRVAYGAQDWSTRLVDFGRGKNTGSSSSSSSVASTLLGRLSASPTAISTSAELLSAQSLVAVGAEDGSVRVFDVRAGQKPIVELVDHGAPVSDVDAEATRALCLGRDARFLLHGSLQGGWIREGPRGSWRVRHALNRGLTAAALVPTVDAWRDVAMVSAEGFGVAALDCETGVLDDEATRVAREPCLKLCAFASVDAVASHAAETEEGNARRRGWFARVFG